MEYKVTIRENQNKNEERNSFFSSNNPSSSYHKGTTVSF